MNDELQILEVLQPQTPAQYQFVVDADLARVGGGSAYVDY